MSGKTFVDTSVLIDAHDSDAGVKREIARDRLRDLWAGRSGVLSTQVLHEFYVNATRKIATRARRLREYASKTHSSDTEPGGSLR